MSGILSKITRYVKQQKNTAHNKEGGNQPIETDPETTQMTVLVEKSIKTIVVTTFHMFKKIQEKLSILNGNIKKSQILEMKTKMSETEKKLDPEFSWELPSWYLARPCQLQWISSGMAT